MYARFEIVWPVESTGPQQLRVVDALSYGLATLVMGNDVLRASPALHTWCSRCGCNNAAHQRSSESPDSLYSPGFRNLRRGNDYAQFTRHFSVANGPEAWMHEYAITKDVGKLLGTVVAMAVARMINLESFTWDMPTGIVREVWLALSSLADRPGHECRLESVWVRWHDNGLSRSLVKDRDIAEASMGSNLGEFDDWSSYRGLQRRYIHVEYPTFSVLPPLKSLSVLDIDEASYLEEMQVLIQRSRPKLRVLRIGMSQYVEGQYWYEPMEDITNEPVPSEFYVVPCWPRIGGVLSVLLNVTPEQMNAGFAMHANPERHPDQQIATATSDLRRLTLEMVAATGTTVEGNEHNIPTRPPKFDLEVLELERITMCIPILAYALNWRRLTSLTLLRCKGHESLWRLLRRHFTPEDVDQSSNLTVHGASPMKESKESVAPQYVLQLKRIHTDAVSTYLMLFLKESIAPNTLEYFLVQETPQYESVISAEAIYWYVVRRHRRSLKKLLVDATKRYGHVADDRWRKWRFNREMLSVVTSGRMPQLTELGITMDRADWVSNLFSFKYSSEVAGRLKWSSSTFLFVGCRICLDYALSTSQTSKLPVALPLPVASSRHPIIMS
jgi:hypothetical protein